MLKILQFIIWGIFLTSIPLLNLESREITKEPYSIQYLGVYNLDQDSIKDTVIAYKYSNKVVLPKYIYWGKGPTGQSKKTEIIYPNRRIIKATCILTNVNKDSISDFFISVHTAPRADSSDKKGRPFTYILYGDSSLKNTRRVNLDEILPFQRQPFLAQGFTRDRHITQVGYDRLNGKPFTLIGKIDTDSLYEEQQQLFNVVVDKTEQKFKTEIFPNPASNNLTVIFESTSDEALKLSVLSSIGYELMSRDIAGETGRHSEILDISGLPSGVYYLSLTRSNGQVYHYSFIVLH